MSVYHVYQAYDIPSSGSSSPHKFLSTGSPIYKTRQSISERERKENAHLYRPLWAGHQTHHHTTDDYTRQEEVCPIHLDGNPIVHCQ